MKKKAVKSKKARKFLVIHGPNLNLLGSREQNIYGNVTIKDINGELKKGAEEYGVDLKIAQSNHEGDIVDLIGKAQKEFDGILINPAAYTHTSVAIRDALLASNLKAVEVHLSNIYRREDFRKVSLTAPACVGQISGFGKESYLLGFKALVELVHE